LHFGSIIAALGSFLDARRNGARWLLRIEDLDRPRVRPGAADRILATLDRLGLQWDGDVLFQSTRLDAYHAAIDQLRGAGLLYACDCPRRVVGNRVYPGTCRERGLAALPRRALRVRVGAASVAVADLLRGTVHYRLNDDVGDFIVRRADGVIAYHLASVTDDHWQQVTSVVRGTDLLESTAPQNHLRMLLGLSMPEFCHLPVAVDSGGRKISKRLGADDVLLETRPLDVWRETLAFLGQSSAGADARDVQELRDIAIAGWSRDAVPRIARGVRRAAI
jgi:glutamyl-Q tRNA(Asp) synthetase